MNRRSMARWVAVGLSLCGLAGCRAKPRDEMVPDRSALTGLVARIGGDILRIEERTRQLAEATVRTYADADAIIARVDTNGYAFAPNGCYYKAVDDGGPALWVSGVVPVDASVRRVAWATEGIDKDLRAILRELPAVAQAYFNDRHSLNRIFPPFDVLSQYEPKMAIPTFNFYYLADAAHNPGRSAVWVDEPYVDPAGRGWMVSCIAPVYRGDDLMGVVGLDVTVAGIVGNYLQPATRAWALVDRNGTIVAATEVAIEVLGMPPLADHRYLNTVRSDRYRSEDYNLLQSPDADVRGLAEVVLRQGARRGQLGGSRKQRPVLAEPVPKLGWTALLVAE